MTIAVNSAYKKRKGSVLLQTLVMCIVLASIAVTLTKWVLARYVGSSNLRDNLELSSMMVDVYGYQYSETLIGCFREPASSPNCSGNNYYGGINWHLYGWGDPGPCSEGAGQQFAGSWGPTSIDIGNGAKIQKITTRANLPWDDSEVPKQTCPWMYGT